MPVCVCVCGGGVMIIVVTIKLAAPCRPILYHHIIVQWSTGMYVN